MTRGHFTLNLLSCVKLC